MSAKKYAKSLIKKYSKKYKGKRLKKEVLLHINAILNFVKECYERFSFYASALSYIQTKL